MPLPPDRPKRVRVSDVLLLWLLKGLWAAFVITTPLLGAWTSSSLAAYLNGPTALAAASGLLLFPALPLAWDAWSTRRRGRDPRKAKRPRILTFWDRFILRTLGLNLLFLGVLLGTSPATAFTALSTRGDWMLDGHHGESAEAVRKELFRMADRLEWIYLAVHTNPFDQKGDQASDTTSTTGGSSTAPTGSAAPSDTSKPSPVPPPAKDSPKPAEGSSEWPSPSVLDPLATEIPAASEDSIASVARFIADRASDPARRFRAAHDWVADRIAYDAPAYVSRNFPPQDAETVFRSRKGVCAGYARLLVAFGQALGVETLYVVGDARTSGQHEHGESHAWNAVKLHGRYYLVDATWDSGSVDGTKFTKGYTTDYYLTPAEVFGLDHFPGEARWQLRDQPISRGEFMRQPMMTPRFFAESRKLVSPDRSQVTVSGPLVVEMGNPRGFFTLADFYPEGGGQGQRCEVENGAAARVTCSFPSSGMWVVKIFSGEKEYGQYHYIGQVEANKSGG
jgi:Transglutaminase-like superfamily